MGESVIRTCTPFGRVRTSQLAVGLSKKKVKKHTTKTKRDKLVLPKTLRDLQAVVISLERRPDRLAGCGQRLHQNCRWLQYQPFRASDGRTDPISVKEVTKRWHTGKNVVYQKIRAVRKGWDDLDTYVVRELDHSAGERGCSSSHIRAWRHCLEQSGGAEKPLLVLEDDAAPTADFTAVLARAMAVLPSDAHVLYLGYSQAADWKREISDDVVEAEYVWTTVGYIIWPAGARILLDRLPIDQPVDNWMATACAEGAIKSYCVRPKIIRQADAWNVNSDVGHSDELYWGPCSDIRHSDALYWGPETEGHAARNAELAKTEPSIFFGPDSGSSDSDDDI